MTPQLEISVEGNLGVIALNRPEAINALSREMIDGIFATLEAWRQDEAVRVVLFEARGSRGFCAGGDVRAIRKLALDLRLARFIVRQPDFVEGVRAVLVDKDQTPRWRPAALEGVDVAGITRALSD